MNRFWILVLLSCTSCQTPVAPATTQKVGDPPPPMAVRLVGSQDAMVGSDQCAAQLHDIEGALIGYYAVNRKLPDTLEELKPYADTGVELKFTCPVSNQPYGYSPAGLMADGYEKRIVVWDPTPAHDGKRWCIFMPRLQPKTPIVPDVLPLPEKVFAAFVPAIQ